MTLLNLQSFFKLRSRLYSALADGITTGLEALLILSLIATPWQPVLLIASPSPAKAASPADSLSGVEQMAHVLNRITYGARPGDIERVQKMGLKNFIEQQLHPEKIPDPAVEQKLAALETLTMTSAELVQEYPPAKLIKQFRERQREALEGPHAKDSGEATAKDDDTASSPDSLKPLELKSLRKQRKLPPMEAEAARHPNMKLEGPREILKELQQAKILRAVYSERQLYEEMVDFWENHFNIFAGKGADRWLLTEYDRDVIRPNTMGKFKDLVEATAHSPAMLFYLDNWLSADPNALQPPRGKRNRSLGARRFDPFGRPFPGSGYPFPQNPDQPQPTQNGKNKKRGLNENYARELMELHTMGVDGGYTQKDVTEVARCFTGWTIRQPRQGGGFFFNDHVHDNGVKRVLGHKIHAGGERDGEEVINILVHHPSTAHFIAKKLVTRFVSDNPPEPLVERVAATYTQTDGDIREMLRTIFYSPEFNSKAAFRAKVKSPFELVASALRTSGGDTDASAPLLQFIARMGQPLFLYQAPTGYPDRASEWLNSGTLLTRMNFALTFAANKIPGTNVEFSRLLGEVTPTQAGGIRSRLLQVFLLDDVSEQTRAALSQDPNPLHHAAANPPDDGWRLTAENKTFPIQIAGLIIGSPEFQRR